jgi:hypothetical protein
MRSALFRFALTLPGTRARMAAGPPSPEPAGMRLSPCPAAAATADVPRSGVP